MKENADMIRYKRVVFALVLFLLPCFSFAHAQMAGYDILNLDFSARASGMGGAFAGVHGDANSLFYNPAGLATIDKELVSISYVDHVLDINSGNGVLIKKTSKAVYAAGITYINYGDFEGRDVFGNDTGTFGAQDAVITGGMARKYSEKLYYGLAAKAVYSKIHTYSSSAAALDAGMMYLVPDQQLSFGLGLSNIGTVFQAYQDEKDTLPMAIKAGVAKQLAHLPLLISLEVRQFFDSNTHVVGGGEFTFSEYLKGRFGYNSYASDQKLDDDNKLLYGFSFGIGLNWKKYVIDYSFSSMGIIGNLNRLTLNFTY